MSTPIVPSVPEDVILVSKRSGVWNVKLNGRFYGDYVRAEHALEAAREKRQCIIAKGGCARVVTA